MFHLETEISVPNFCNGSLAQTKKTESTPRFHIK